MIKNLVLMLIAFILVVTLSPIVFIVNLFRYNLKEYFYTVAIGLDQLGGSILYNEEDWTVSSYTYMLACEGNRRAELFMKFIDFIFGDGHCEKSFFKEFFKEGGMRG